MNESRRAPPMRPAAAGTAAPADGTLACLPIGGAFVAQCTAREDARGSFTRLFCAHAFAQAHGDRAIVQINWSHTVTAGTVRGLHYQADEAADAKWVRCVTGSVWDVIVDLRATSPTFMQWHAVALSDANRCAVFVPEGCAHGFQSLTDDCELLYLHTAAHAPAAERGIAHDDPALGIKWPRPVTVISPRDAALPRWRG